MELSRRGSYVVEQRPGSNPMPVQGATPEQLHAYWSEMIGTLGGQHSRRLDTLQRAHEAEQRGEASSAQSGRIVAYRGKIEIKTLESVAALLHEILAPAAPFLCDGDCGHLARGATPEQAKRFLDSLDAEIAQVTKRRDACERREMEDDYAESLYVLKRWRGAWADRVGPSNLPAGV